MIAVRELSSGPKALPFRGECADRESRAGRARRKGAGSALLVLLALAAVALILAADLRSTCRYYTTLIAAAGMTPPDGIGAGVCSILLDL